MDTTAVVETPERVRFRTRLAGAGLRSAAWMLDVLVIFFLLCLVVVAVILVSFDPVLGGLGQGALLVAWFLSEWGYFTIAETLMRGQTPGKWAMGIRVVRLDGSPGRFGDYVLRNLLRGVDGAFAYLPGIVCMASDSRFRRLGDIVAGTIVVREKQARVLSSVQIVPPVSEEERQALPVSVVLKSEEIVLIEQFLRRRPLLSAGRAEEIACLLGPSLSERTGVEAPTWERVLTLAYARASGRERGGSDDGS